VLNRKHQRGLSRVLGLGAMSPEKLFGEVQAFRSGGVISGRRQTGPSFLGGGSGSGSGSSAATVEQHVRIEVPPHFSDTRWAVERGLERATWRLRKGI